MGAAAGRSWSCSIASPSSHSRLPPLLTLPLRHRQAGQRFFDITEHDDFAAAVSVAAGARSAVVAFPTELSHRGDLQPLLAKLSQTEMQANLEQLSSFHTRYYKSDYGRQSSEWLLSRIREVIGQSPAAGVNITATAFPHRAFPQASIVVRMAGRTDDTVVVGAHQDSINLFLPSLLAAPGADDDGSGTVTILEALRVLLTAPAVVAAGGLRNTLEFHWYAAEEGGLLGSQDLFKTYAGTGRRVKAMLQQDMTGFVARTLQAGQVESVGVIVDFVSPELTAFVKRVIDGYCDIPWVETQCGYACSDHASASKAGYPSAFVIESAFEYSDNHIHGTDDVIKYLDFGHMAQHAKMTLAFAYELAFADFDKLEAGQRAELR